MVATFFEPGLAAAFAGLVATFVLVATPDFALVDLALVDLALVAFTASVLPAGLATAFGAAFGFFAVALVEVDFSALAFAFDLLSPNAEAQF